MRSFSEFHDGFLDGLLVRNASAYLFLRTTNEEEFVLRMSGVLSLKADGFRQGNIIFDVLVRSGDELTAVDMVDLFGFKDEAQAAKKLEESRQNGQLIIEVNPSYGAECFILAQSVDLVSRDAWAEGLVSRD